ncbi:class I SAM-dependent methyltransferase [Streptomyces sp. SID13031]|uniref:class I SAM-dependent methyltransferase n=1 Tax=Streptomyces sp. SID13031 TaxID=2706046 RepID=UPI0013C55EA2|nr:class I SAM-dependent methyltransferase [Streptomyces sp. SID13031]NEA34738.1 class I SAM-dependent methyltransferase [Streptomyces sp. SID13031]
MEQGEIDAGIQHYYSNVFDEDARLTTRSAQSALEFIRVQELVGDRIGAGSKVVDIGGATGIHAAPLAAAGHEVTLVDPVEEQVAKAQRHGTFPAEVGDARQLRFADDSFDVALLFGPLYHLRTPEDRLKALREAARVVVPGGWVFAAAIPRFIHHAAVSLGREAPNPYPAAWIELLESGTPIPGGRFPAGHLHTAEELQTELTTAGLTAIELHAIEGPAGFALEQLPSDEDLLQAALTLVRRTGHLKAIRDLTTHLMAIGRTPSPTTP